MFNPEDLLDKNGKPSSRKMSMVLEELKDRTSWMKEDASPAERLWNLYHRKTQYEHNCLTCGAPIKWTFWTNGYGDKQFCSTKCWQVERKKKYAAAPKIEKVLLSKEERLNRQEQANLKKYGVRWPWMLDEVKQKRLEVRRKLKIEQWLKDLERRNIKPLFTVDDYIDSRSKLAARCQCGTEFKIQRYKENSTPNLCPTCFTPHASRWQHEINDFIRAQGVQTVINDRKTLGNKYEIDIFIPALSLGIECDGVFWHSEQGRPTIKEDLQTKISLEQTANIKILRFFDFEYALKADIIKSMIINAIKKTPRKIDARKCVINRISTDEAKEFFNKTHLQGQGTGVTYGLYYNEDLVSAMQVCEARWVRGALEISRFSTALQTTVRGGASKLLKHIMTLTPHDTIISYSDNRTGTGATYETIGFKNTGFTGMGFFYFNNTTKEIKSRYKMQKHKLPFLDGETEEQACKRMGWTRVWTPGNQKWILKIPNKAQ